VKSLTQDFLAGNKFIFTHAGLAFVFIAMAVAMFVLSSFSPLISIYIRDTLHAGTIIFGAVSAMVGVGMIVGTQLVTRLAGGRSKANVRLLKNSATNSSFLVGGDCQVCYSDVQEEHTE
jgi:hypothetical protein